MMAPLPALITQTDALIGPQRSRLPAAATADAVAGALAQLSVDQPRPVLLTLAAGTGPRRPLPTPWDGAAGRLVAVEYPLDQTPPALLPAEAWGLLPVADAQGTARPGALWLDPAWVPATAAVRVQATAPHQATGSGSSLSGPQIQAVIALAAALLLEQLAHHLADESDPLVLGAPVAAQGSTSDRLWSRSRALRARYQALIAGGIEGGEGAAATPPAAAGVAVALDVPRSWGRRDLIRRRGDAP